ncbi:MAG: HAD-IG family 5'-nucleotidase [Actinomycetia bacterium]|nr:HAD-IG family 5'-nucleotidase [Actinomycetes bacterium]MCP4958295.1 HAD-IG family 5'-nucleotidase [Actinomycetes bacterium]
MIDDPPAGRGIYANRTLNVRSLRAIGYDMDYTLIHYRVDEWERAAFAHARRWLAGHGWPVDELEFDPGLYTLGLTFDLELGNLVKATRFGHVVRVQHGTRALEFEEQRSVYAETVIDLSEDRFEFMNTLFELSRAALWCQLVDIHDAGRLPGVVSYAALWREIDSALTSAHNDGMLKAEIVADPSRFVVPDPGLVETLRDQRVAGKQLLLITNSDWSYTRKMMGYAVDPYVDDGTWRDLFDIVIVSANKPGFFAGTPPIYRVVDEENSLLRPHSGDLEQGHVYFGGNARLVEQSLGHSAAQMLYVGDHLFGDVHVTKDTLRWRTALIAREIEPEVEAAATFADDEQTLVRLMGDKAELERRIARRRLTRRKQRSDRPSAAALQKEIDLLVADAAELDARIGPLAQASSELSNPTWGPLMRSGNDKSLFARQVERYADVYTSRVSNFGYETPYGYIRAARGSLPHDVVRP